MRRYHVLFDWPIAEINRLTDSHEAEVFVATLDAQAEASFISLTEEIRGLGADLATAKAARIHFSDWPLLQQNINTFATQFPGFPNATYRKLKAFIVLASMLSTTGAALDLEDINESLFEIRHLRTALPLHWFARENNASYDNSLVVMCCSDFGALEQEFQADAARMSPRVVFHALATIAQAPELPSSHVALIKRSPVRIPDETVAAFVHLHILAQGKEIHTPRQYTAPPQTGNLDDINPEYPYHQWDDVLEVLSEYNSRNDPLLKFLTIYHVVENFMFKRPIVELERRQGGRMFSIRDFRRMYNEVDMGEAKALSKLFTAAFQVITSGANTIEQRVLARWLALLTIAPVIDIEAALREMGIHKQHSQFVAGNQAPAFFSDLVYTMRCAIVHNKETEFHLTYASLTNGFTALIESFLLRSLEELCFILIGVQNQHVWYSNRDMKLY